MLKRLLIAGFLITATPALADPAPQENSMLLVATSELPDPRFKESVVLVTRDNKNGPVGVIINRPLKTELQTVFPNYPALTGNTDKAFYGGPAVGAIIVFLLRAKTRPREAFHVFDDVYLSLSKNLFEALLQRENPTAGLRIFIGYSGWTEKQLQQEIDKGYWNVKTPDHETIYSAEPDRLWPRLSREFEGKWVLPTGDDTWDSDTLMAFDKSSHTICEGNNTIRL